MAEKNPAALAETAAKLNDAVERGFWTPRSNSARFILENLQKLNPERATNG
jgi:cobaltochelatase CobN